MRRPAVLVALALVLIACGLSVWHGLDTDEPTAADGPPAPDEPTASAGSPAPPSDEQAEPLRTDGFETLFVPDARATTTQGEEVTIALLDGGLLDLPSGRLIACDPFVQATDHEYQKPFTDTVAPGTYPVTAALATFAEGHHRVAAARLTVLPDPVTHWHLAVQPGENPADLGPDEFYRYGVDAGTAAFVDATALPALTRLAAEEEDPLAAAMFADETSVLWNLRDQQSGRNIVAFQSGFGDGAYPTWVGRTAGGAVAQFVTDFQILKQEQPDTR